MQIEENYRIKIAGAAVADVTRNAAGISLKDHTASPDVISINEHTLHVLLDNAGYNIELIETEDDGKKITLKVNGKTATLEVHNRVEQMLESMGFGGQQSHKANVIKSPMPGMVLKVFAEPGMSITKGTPLLVLEAMKMENIIKANSDGVVKDVHVSPMMKVEKNFAMVVLE